MPGNKRVEVNCERITVTIPDGLHSEMLQLLTTEKKWVDRQDFIRQSIREKIDRWKVRS